MKRYTNFVPEAFINLMGMMLLVAWLCAAMLPHVLSDIQFGAPHGLGFYVKTAVWFVLFGVLVYGYRKLQTIEVMRYDAIERQFVRCVWQHTHWHAIQHYPQSEFTGVVAEKIDQAGSAQYGRVFLRGHHGDLLIKHILPHNGRIRGVASCYEKVAQVSQLPKLGYHKMDVPCEIVRTAQHQHCFRAILPPTVSLWQWVSELMAAIIRLILGIWVVDFFSQRSEMPTVFAWLLDELGIVDVTVVQMGWLLGGVLWLFALRCCLKAVMLWRNWVKQRNSIPSVPVRDVYANKHSGEFVLFSRRKYVVVTFLVLLVLMMMVSGVSWRDVPLILTMISGAVAILAPVWQTAFAVRKLVYHALNDSFTIYKLSETLMWQPERQCAVDDFIGITCENDGALWLVGEENGVDICLGKASGFSQNARERALWLAQKISQATGLPFVVRVDSV